MYQLGQGNHPPFPVEKMNSEMLEFLDFCFEPDPKNRADINKLSDHPFVEVIHYMGVVTMNIIIIFYIVCVH